MINTIPGILCYMILEAVESRISRQARGVGASHEFLDYEHTGSRWPKVSVDWSLLLAQELLSGFVLIL